MLEASHTSVLESHYSLFALLIHHLHHVVLASHLLSSRFSGSTQSAQVVVAWVDVSDALTVCARALPAVRHEGGIEDVRACCT